MVTMTVKEFKTHFSKALKRVMLGEEIRICYENGKEIIASSFQKIQRKKVKERSVYLIKDRV